MILNILLLIIGLALVVGGANFLTDGAASIAKRFRLSDLVIGLTVLAFGTSAPELTVSLMAALKGSADIAIGNVIGSNIFNILAIVGITALIMPLTMSNSTIRIEIPLTILSSAVLFFMANDRLFDMAGENVITRTEGFVLLAFFLIFLFYTFNMSKGEESPGQVRQFALPLSIIMVIGGLVALVFGGDLFVDNAAMLAGRMGVSESVVAITIVAGGTSLPELVTTLVAAIKKRPGMAIGNIVGSNLFNILLILGVSSSISPIRIQGITVVDYGIFILSAILLYVFGLFFGDKTIKRFEGSILLSLFICYTVYLVMTA
ncbi:K+-dependent Na+/Ca+ exchanger related-protein [Porphyromonas gingivalis TDC60]|uniref:K+-dependent Na+/Ca+ exchanger related-protein n=3 Tax=Porphyromonas gingivalis TaxID=837 RepID=Q7MVL3_PORGI|nr:calcium/sodium antiporter [Porphyromonas gingivalis]AAQ66160.1 K+-dependent Na+/Ca+ exchanger related-protein [Porphyromonas gingivalis W83]AKV64144.1 K+dependent Na+ exchanger related-protein [Porphyromonas gingivalis]ALJ25752.1 K+dependent Na+ exchanger related-protein [Porphyromonas gingivalis 381]ATR95491.1 sodium:proton exchanger [Porphyromonas gingivalis]ATR96701.1 sodium:proton exchanger [Porphyromonas gingivalis]